MVKVCAIAAQPGHTKELQSVQLERGLRIVDSPGVIFEDDDSIQGQKESSVLLRNVVKPEDVDDPISVGGCASSPSPLRGLISELSPVEEILARTQTERLMKIYDLPTFSSTLQFLTMLALSTGRLLKARLSSSLLRNSKNDFFPHRVAPPTLSLRRVMSSSTGTAKKYRSSPSRRRCTPRIYPQQSPVAGRLHLAPR